MYTTIQKIPYSLLFIISLFFTTLMKFSIYALTQTNSMVITKLSTFFFIISINCIIIFIGCYLPFQINLKDKWESVFLSFFILMVLFFLMEIKQSLNFELDIIMFLISPLYISAIYFIYHIKKKQPFINLLILNILGTYISLFLICNIFQ